MGIGLSRPTKQNKLLRYPTAIISWPLERTATTSVRLGKTTLAELERQFGDPLPSAVFNNDDPETQYALYSLKYDPQVKGCRDGDDMPLENQLFVIKDKLVIAQARYSSYESNHTDFDADKREKLVVGKTTRDEALSILGPPNGTRHCPKDVVYAPTGLEYLYVHYVDEFSLGSKYRLKWLTVEFEQGIVSAVRYREGKSTKEPEVEAAATHEPASTEKSVADDASEEPPSATTTAL
ncbi:hypothetical protein PLANPX_2811 [Lacipirellula parvula]|uniref:Lipoprotein SmpA/OmlA domain-containing protein n=2 Tax=Lacipirellula parvula TaxID=2650471 RepID=A0A5K7XJX9_9BACT|nr:hypothetical protein PLANPX_2811 [Lacipirellula parvula]